MTMIEDPNRQLNYLRQCLSSDKRPLALFLGAGCPMAVQSNSEQTPLIPDIAGITRIIRGELQENTECKPLLEIIDAHFDQDERSNATVEDMLTHIRALRAVAGNGKVRELSANQLDTLDKEICELIHRVVDKELPDSETPYHSAASWVGATQRDNPIEIFTTNYDLLIEQAFELFHIPYFDGFVGSRKPFFDLRAVEEDQLPPRWARLWKLHGSINWCQVANCDVLRGATRENEGSKRVIHPSHLKYQESRRMPYLAMLDRLRAFLLKPASTLIICGYSFRDEHINEVIVQGLQSTQTAVAFALLYGSISDYSQAVALAKTRSNLNLLARNGAVIGGQDHVWPERDAESGSADSCKWLRWKEDNPGTRTGRLAAEFLLGDFAVFGQFLQELVGTTRQAQAIQNVE